MYKTNTHKYGAALLLFTLISGCASSTPPTSLQRMKMSMVSRLAADCYWEHEGERFVFGSSPVWSACRRWAHKAVNGKQALVAGVEVQNR
ncbi:MAG: hypothetical protein OES38_04490 [Gammaproteobacteria bacterium]|nr:hypothetical protein [Gammaproteobacteria bacterium]